MPFLPLLHRIWFVFSFASVHAIAPFHSEGLGHFPTSNFQPTHRRTGGRKYGKGTLSYACYETLSLTTYNTGNGKFDELSQKKNAAICDVSITLYKQNERTLFPRFVVVGFLYSFCSSRQDFQIFFAHTVKHSIELTAARGFLLFPFREKNWSTDTSSRVTSSYKICKLGCCPLFSMDAIYRGAIFSVSANWLRDIPFAFLAALMACPKALKSNFSLFCFIVISPNYIVYFIFLSRYDYTQHIIDWNRAYHILDIIRLSEYNYTGKIWGKGVLIMEYMSCPEAAKKWGISERRVQILCSENRIPGVSKLGYMWLIPKTRKNLLIWERNNIKCRYNKQTNKPYNNCKWCGCFLCSKIIFVR